MVADETHAPNMVAPLFTVFLFLFSSIFCFFFATIWVVKLGNCSLELGATRHFSETWRQSDECAYGPPTITEFYRVFTMNAVREPWPVVEKKTNKTNKPVQLGKTPKKRSDRRTKRMKWICYRVFNWVVVVVVVVENENGSGGVGAALDGPMVLAEWRRGSE